MDFNIERIKAIAATITSVLIMVTGDSYKHITVLLLLMFVDTVVGWIKGFKLKKWKSNKARWGAVGKFVEMMIIACLYGLDWVFSLDCLKYIGIYYFGICEIASIIENFAEIGGNVPKGMIELLKEIQYNIGTESAKKIKKICEDIFGGESDNGNDK